MTMEKRKVREVMPGLSGGSELSTGKGYRTEREADEKDICKWC